MVEGIVVVVIVEVEGDVELEGDVVELEGSVELGGDVEMEGDVELEGDVKVEGDVDALKGKPPQRYDASHATIRFSDNTT